MKDYAVDVSVPLLFQGREQHFYKVEDGQVTHWTLRFRIYKFLFDKILSVTGVILTVFIALILLCLNPFLNPGPLFFRQVRLGKNKRPFKMLKFRTMLPADPKTARSATDALEVDRITRLGRSLRKFRIDEIPNFFNVVLGDMSVIGPRPDSLHHAEHFSRVIDHYDYRFLVKPGITGLAQIESGYAEGVEATAIKAHYDQIYVQTSSGRLDVYIAYRTFLVMLTGFGAR